MAGKRRLRRARALQAPKIRRAGDARAAAQRDEARAAILLGGARDPAETAAERLGARALGLAPGPVATPGGPAPGARPAPLPAPASRALAALGPGRPLDSPARAFFEPRFGRALGHVRLHDGASADRAARALGAAAFTRGPDIGLAAGENRPATVAHELAHVAAGPSPLVRRKIKVKDDPKIDLIPSLRAKGAGQGKAGLTAAAGLLSAPAFLNKSPVEAQIAQNLAASERIFPLAGGTQKEVAASLDAQIGARREIVDFAKGLRVGFTARGPKIDPAYADLTFGEVRRRLTTAEAQLRAQGRRDDEIRAILKANAFPTLVRVFEDIAGTAGFTTAIADIRSKSRDFDRKAAQQKTASPAYDYAMACQFATMTVMYGGAQAPLKSADVSGTAVTSAAGKEIGKSDRTSAVWTDWVPGDWGYVKNTGTQTPAPGQEGENMISVGNERFWAHDDPKKAILSLPEVMDKVRRWNKSASLQPLRRYPSNGLT
ncbi:DUF4157 domain-containing protein [Cereibacter sphaeroides]|uniref:eCIS core domain-containing protein n=1 Tax=Cereibacter sphaeroides TaxID=1063 RepID=UPI001F46F87E|nr:DUF4157 domain-containing protein [Cereibacter sphaeroides]MCE6953105.1 DUF4157 domain-containing protein [Cereibacter sphaeroides]